MTAKDIERRLELKYCNALYTVPNVYFFKWESDFLVVQRSGIIIEVETKISVADYKKDFCKINKHEDLKNRVPNIPNKFYYACPENLIKVEDIPEYAGLLYIDSIGRITEVKKAPVLHKNKLEYKDNLITKFYYGYLDAKRLKADDVVIEYNKQIRQKDKKIEEDRCTIIGLRNQNIILLNELKQLERKKLPSQD